jgi:hypothetical protein
MSFCPSGSLLWISAGGFGEQQAWFCRDTGKAHYRSDFDDDGEELPDDIDDTRPCWKNATN